MSDNTPIPTAETAEMTEAATEAATEAVAPPELLQTPAQPALQAARNSLMQWPNDAPMAEVQALVDNEFIIAMNAGPPELWQPWQARRMSDLVRWITQTLWWQQWTRLAPDSERSLPLSEMPIMTRKSMREALQAGAGNPEQPTTPDLPPEHGQLGLIQTAGVSGQPMLMWLSEFQARMASAHFRANHFQQGRDPARSIGTLSEQIDAHPGAECVAANSYAFLGENSHEGQAHWGRSWATSDAAGHARWLSANPVAYLSVRADRLSEVLAAFEADESISRPAIEQVLTQGLQVDTVLRARCQAVLGARIADVYATTEIGPVAFQCPHSGNEAPHYHVAVTNAVVQVVRKDKGKPTKFGYMADEGEAGRVLLTGIHQFASPVLRLETGDTARLHNSCPVCGAMVPTLSDLNGPEHLRLKLPTGERAPFVRLHSGDWRVMLGQPALDARLLQLAPNVVRVEVVLPAGQAADLQGLRQTVQQHLAQRISDQFSYELHVVPAIDWAPETPAHLRHPIESILRDAAPAGKP